MTKREVSIFLSACAFIFTLSGCTTTPRPTIVKEIPKECIISKNDTVKTYIEPATGVVIEDSEKERITYLINENIYKMKLSNNNDNGTDYEVHVLLTRYDKGNAFARAMLIGLGQMHITGDIKLVNGTDNKTLGEFTSNKDLILGGLAGAVATIDKIEKEFAAEIAATVTGKLK